MFGIPLFENYYFFWVTSVLARTQTFLGQFKKANDELFKEIEQNPQLAKKKYEIDVFDEGEEEQNDNNNDELKEHIESEEENSENEQAAKPYIEMVRNFSSFFFSKLTSTWFLSLFTEFGSGSVGGTKRIDNGEYQVAIQIWRIQEQEKEKKMKNENSQIYFFFICIFKLECR